MEQLIGLDAVFLAVERPENPMNIGSVGVFEGPPPAFAAATEFVASRIEHVPRCRQRVREPWGRFGRRVWIDDSRFVLTDHFHHSSIATESSSALDEFVEDVMARPLDRRHPLWEMWLVEGLSDERWALVTKVHHCMVDGIAGTDLLTAMLDREPAARPSIPPVPTPSAEPSVLDYARFSVRSAMRSARARGRGVLVTLTHPRRSWIRLRDTATGAKRLWYRRRSRGTSLTGPIGPHPRWAHVSVRLDDVDTVRHALGGTVNDVVVAIVTRAFRVLLMGRGEPVAGRTVTALVPVSLRTPAERGRLDNRVADVHALLPVGVADPVAAFRTVHGHLDDLKTSHEVEASGALMRMGEWAPRFIADLVARAVVRRQKSVETVVTNVPGPRSPLHLCDRTMLEAIPCAPIAGEVRITVAVWSYCGHLSFGVTGDRSSTGDIDRLVDGIRAGLDELMKEASRSARQNRP